MKEKNIYKYYLFLTLLIYTQLDAVIVSGVKLKHPTTGKIVYLFADVHVESTASDSQQLKFFEKLLGNNSNADIFIDSFRSSDQDFNGKDFNVYDNRSQDEKSKIRDKFLRLQNDYPRNVKKFVEKRNFIQGLNNIVQNFLELNNINSLIAKISSHCITTNGGLNIIPDLRFDSVKVMEARNVLLSQNMPGISLENIKSLSNENLMFIVSTILNKDAQNLELEYVEKHISSSDLDFLELNIIKYLSDNPEKPLIAIIGASHVIKLYQLLTSKHFGYEIDKNIKLETITKKSILGWDQATRNYKQAYTKSLEHLRSEIVEETRFSMISSFFCCCPNQYFKIKQMPIEEYMDKLEGLKQIFADFFPGLTTEELEYLVNEFKKVENNT